MNETSGSNGVSTKLQQIAELSRRMPGVVLTTLSHHIDLEFLHEAYQRTRKDGATGVDEVTAANGASGRDGAHTGHWTCCVQGS